VGICYVRQVRIPAFYKGRALGLLINFNARLLKDDVQRLALRRSA
jgi:hypothetical protein